MTPQVVLNAFDWGLDCTRITAICLPFAQCCSFFHRTPSNLSFHPGLWQINEALPHLLEAVSIDPDSAKYRHTLGLAKCATGDEKGAREDLLEAAMLDEEDAEDRYLLRMQRISEKRRRNNEQQRMLRESRESEEPGAQQVRR